VAAEQGLAVKVVAYRASCCFVELKLAIITILQSSLGLWKEFQLSFPQVLHIVLKAQYHVLLTNCLDIQMSSPPKELELEQLVIEQVARQLAQQATGLASEE
jgi:hypothetical protein